MVFSCFTSISIFFQKYVSLCLVLITMVLAMGVIIIEGIDATLMHRFFKKNSFCETDKQEQHDDRIRSDCAKYKEAYRWYFTLVFITDIVLVLCFIVVLLLFADWILFVAPVRIMLVL